MPLLHIAFRSLPGPGGQPDRLAGWPGALPAVVTAPAQVSLASTTGDTLLNLDLDPAEARLTAAGGADVLHYWRLADATLKPLPPAPPPLTLQPGDTYVAVTAGAQALAAGEPGGASAAVARFVHLRDYFNADRLASALLAHLLELGGQAAPPETVSVLVIEAR